MSGAPPKVVQKVMRHETIELTMRIYRDMFPKNEADAKDSDSIDSDDEIWQEATSRRQSANINSGSLQRVLRASTLATYNETVSTGEAKSDRNMEPLLKSMRTSHFQVHRSENANNIGTSSPRQVKNDGRVLKDYARMGSVVAVVFVLVMAVFSATRYIQVPKDDLP